jgi:RimJ/RimL family protein N-acetyltransferase
MQRFTERLVLRPPRAEDLDMMFAVYGDSATHQFNPAGPLADKQQASALIGIWMRHWQKHGYGWWAVANRAAPEQLIGFGGIARRYFGDVVRVNLGYRFGVPAWGEGYATELGKATLACAFDELKLPQVHALVRPDHVASIKVLEKIGMHAIDVLEDVPGQAPSRVYLATRGG